MYDIEQLYNEYFKSVYLYVFSLCKDKELSEDITADTFIKVIKNINKFKGDCDIRVWMCQIAKNQYFTYLKKHNLTIELNEELSGFEVDIIQIITNKQIAEKIHTTISNLKDPYGKVAKLRIFKGYSFTEIGKIFNKTSNWACVTYYRAKDMIRKEVSKDERM